jgi:transposase
VKEVREAWFEDQLDLDPQRLVFLDETGITTRMARLRGRAPCGERCRMAVPHGHWASTTLVLSLRGDGLVAPHLRRGAMTGAAFLAYLREELAPTLRKGDTLILDNLPAHKVAGVREAIEAVGARILYVPAYSPDFNPIEQVFAKLKALLRKAAARTETALHQATQRTLRRFKPQECRRIIAAAGYDAD